MSVVILCHAYISTIYRLNRKSKNGSSFSFILFLVLLFQMALYNVYFFTFHYVFFTFRFTFRKKNVLKKNTFWMSISNRGLIGRSSRHTGTYERSWRSGRRYHENMKKRAIFVIKNFSKFQNC